MSELFESPYRVPFDGSFRMARASTSPPEDTERKKDLKQRLADAVSELDSLQSTMYAQDRYALLLVFQAMDAAGKDGTIRAVLTGVNPAGCQVFSFKQPSSLELDHDFLWRSVCALPERGRIGVFNRSYYEEVLVVRVNPELLASQRLPHVPEGNALWAERLESIRDHERHLARNGTVVLKFFLNVSREEQRQRFLSRLKEDHKQWKFSAADLRERVNWDDYMHAYEEALNETSRAWAPWYAIPADDKHFMRTTVAEIIVAHLRSLDIDYPEIAESDRQRIAELQGLLK
ncbi:MAG: polyphosphate kinase 2 family protein [Gammaproteobacteria bacterium]|nr:polyphosphate kinase 2 family protein [Gammaproteobacteria bacterium]